MNLWKEYELIDSGHGRKLERFGPYIIDRPDPQAIWKPVLPPDTWKSADAVYVQTTGRGSWRTGRDLPERWPVRFRNLVFNIGLSPSKHTGLFPEQAPNWLEIQRLVRERNKTSPSPAILNLFAYTGGTTLAAASAGAQVCHVDSSKPAILWARRNVASSGLAEASIRWIQEDAVLFVQRELRRGSRYEGIVMDPPPFGRGPKGKDWKLERDLAPFVESCAGLISERPLFFLINCYATGYSHLSFRNLLSDALGAGTGAVRSGDLFIQQTGSSRVLPCGLFAMQTFS